MKLVHILFILTFLIACSKPEAETTYSDTSTPEKSTGSIKKDRASRIDYMYVEIMIRTNCYPTIKQDLKAGLDKFGYFHKEIDKIIYEKCTAAKTRGAQKEFDVKDGELKALVQ